MVVEALVLQSHGPVDLVPMIGAVALVAALLCVAMLFVNWLCWLFRFIGLFATPDWDEYFRKSNRKAAKLLAWSLKAFFCCVVIFVSVIFLVRLFVSFY